jgi:sterol desaturase/sphingolipid hydroxylase (fatty acid hydroxylase superfamily)
MDRPPAIASILAAVFCLFFVLERLFPLRHAKHPLMGRLWVNLVVSALAIAAASVSVRPVSHLMLSWTRQHDFGLLNLYHWPPVVRFVLAFLLMDLAFYYWHRANHRFGFLWRFHNAHHIDPDLDVSTAFRFHPGEVFFSAGFRIIQLGAIGLSAWAFAIYEICFQVVTLFEHSNIRLPIGLERMFVRVLVTPRMHGSHHSQVRQETNANYSTVFSWWDRLHRTLRLDVPQAEIVIGVPGYALPDDDKLKNVLLVPFRIQREYWPISGDRAGESRPADGASSRWHLER